MFRINKIKLFSIWTTDSIGFVSTHTIISGMNWIEGIGWLCEHSIIRHVVKTSVFVINTWFMLLLVDFLSLGISSAMLSRHRCLLLPLGSCYFWLTVCHWGYHQPGCQDLGVYYYHLFHATAAGLVVIEGTTPVQ